jgi:hypothetical protein
MAKLTAIKVDRSLQGDRVIQPPYKCFCCQDSGLVRSQYLGDYVDGDNDLDFICNRKSCITGQKFLTSYFMSDSARIELGKKNDQYYSRAEDYQANFDPRLDSYSCEEMHDAGLRSWRETLKGARGNAIAISEAVGKL